MSGILADNLPGIQSALEENYAVFPVQKNHTAVGLVLAPFLGPESLLPVRYKYLEKKPGSRYQQRAVNGRIRAEILYRETIGTEALTPEQVAQEYNLPVEAVREAIHYCEHNRELLDVERAREQATIEARGLDQWPHAPQIPESPR